MDQDYLKRTSEQMDQESEYIEQRYLSSMVYKGLGLTRDTLRYYEELGILSPVKNEENNYREYSMNDIMNILAIDFYKKRGITPKELKNIKAENKPENYKQLFIDKKAILAENIRYQKRIMKKLEETIAFMDVVEKQLNQFKVREFPLYEINEEISSFVNLKEYEEKVLRHIDISEDDIYSNLVKAMWFDDKGYLGTKAYLVNNVKRKVKGKKYLDHGEALYIVVENQGNGGDDLMVKMFVNCTKWAEHHQREFKGVVYLQVKCIRWSEKEMKNYVECWIPLRK
ncbi:MAG: MerR family transcriptional regulator [Lachnospiraceae bacterium]